MNAFPLGQGGTYVRGELSWQKYPVTHTMRAERLRQQSCVLWFTGLSGAGKSTLAGLVEQQLFERGYLTYLLDGDNIRHGLCSDLDFSDDDRVENIRRVGEVSKLFVDAGLIVMAAFISPFRHDRALVRQLIAPAAFIEIYVSTPIEVCEARDPKGLYQRACGNQLLRLSGIGSRYEAPQDPELVVDTSAMPVNACVERIVDYVVARRVLESPLTETRAASLAR